ncbi:hypothetical protein OHA84_38695 [Streptomyces sp. NBC_00513]|uniref:hypothetical protein n=1 Tax=unclassified Streptomyces TaxID=2593676 RepID=UPI002250B2BC|nr:hypothetical protein [Streptomyces sp. NBC_00424]MCX5079378.1 hypothetical protein [Streptomyces sp. NBC_00424]MCX5079388.1 hypothetical protein [Streptomyces sp. NBC_00424]WUD46460.1 hypothetical protein OHA84_38745 [Streptomyces sp. NBC_00513]WUD46470.1 hypothetical protein OHA84_38695 [Streptomyces sp. NBC_00513]
MSEEELHRRIVKARAAKHSEAVEEHAREAKRAHRRATKLRRIAAEDGGLVPAAQADLAQAEREARRHDAALDALGDFEIRDVDPGQIRHRRVRIAVARCSLLAVPVGGVVAGSWLLDGVVFLLSTAGAVTACCVRGDRSFGRTVRPVPAELLADTALLVLEPAAPEPEPVDTGKWKQQLLTYVEQAVATAQQSGHNGVHAVDLLHGLHQRGDFLGLTSATFPAKLRDVGVPTKVVSVSGAKAIGVAYDQLAQALGHMPRLPVHLVPDLTQTAPVPHSPDFGTRSVSG